MSNGQNAYNGAAGSQAWTRGHARRGLGRWTAFELIAIVLGFMVFWPIGLGILGYKVWQRKNGGPDLQSMVSDGWSRVRDAFSDVSGTRAWTPSSGNSAFDAWKAAELARLEEERRKLDKAHREFADFMDNVRKAKDREEFERFMNERRNRPGA